MTPVAVARPDLEAERGAGTRRRSWSAPADRRVGLAVAAAAAAAAAAVVLAAVVSGSARPSVVADPGAVTRWGVLLTRTAHDVAAMLTVGVLAVVVLVLPSDRGVLSPSAARLVRLSARWATAWVVLSLLGFVMALSQATASPLAAVLRPDVLALGLELPQTRALVSTAWLAGLVAVWACWTRTPSGSWLLLVTAATALVPPLITGHAAHDDTHTRAVVSLAVHVGAACLWAGGLAALALHLRRSPATLAVALPRYSRMALACFVAVALSGAVTGWTAFAGTAQLWTTSYGQLLLGKVAALLLLGTMGHLHRRRTVQAVVAGRPRAFLALAVAELVLMAGAVGLAVGLSHSAPPLQADHGVASAHV